jgi:UDP-N-acetylmuramate dehydrogenase
MIQIEQNKALASLSTFRMGGMAAYFCSINAKEDVLEAYTFAREKGLPVVVLGGGSNTIFAEPEILKALVIQIAIPGYEFISDELLKLGAGEEWDSVVMRTVEAGYSGMEALSAIPGSVGGTPVQNVGAYGQEVANLIDSLEAFDTTTNTFVTLSNSECKFAYRDSIFKQEAKGRYVIVSVTFKLSKAQPTAPNYPGVASYFEKQGIIEPTLFDIRNAIIEIRKSKLPDPKEIASVGSFFKNPFISTEAANALKSKFEKAVIFPVTETTSKVGAGWMIDSLGLKGKEFGNLMLYPGNAMVIVNKGGATPTELQNLVQDIQNKVREAYGVTIEPEPIFVS